MSAIIEKKATNPYTYKTNKKTLILNKTIYADDGAYFSSSREGAQQATTPVSDFASATGTIVKPTKSFCYSNTKGERVKVRIYTKEGFETYDLQEVDDKAYYRHLGNVQNADGDQSLKNITMHDGSKYEGILSRTKRNMAALKSRNIAGAGVIQVIKTVI